MGLLIAGWTQRQFRRRAAVKLMRQMRLDAHIDVLSQRKYRAKRLDAFPSPVSATNTSRQFSLSGQWGLSVLRAHRNFLVTLAQAGIPNKFCCRDDSKVASVKIATMYRTHYCATRMRAKVLQENLFAHTTRSDRQKRSICLIQKVARGQLARRSADQRSQNFSAIAIQRIVRGYSGRQIFDQKHTRLNAAIHIQALARRSLSLAIHGPRRARLRLVYGPTLLLQSWGRRLNSTQTFRKMHDSEIFHDESVLCASTRLDYCRRSVCVKLCIQSYRSPASYRGEFQAVFAKYCRMYLSSLISEYMIRR